MDYESESPSLSIEKILGSVNVAELLDDVTLSAICSMCLSGLDEDLGSRQEWEENADKIVETAKLEYRQSNTPWDGAANTKYPLIETAVMQFSARMSGNLIKDNKIVKSKAIGFDPTGAKYQMGERVSKFMSYQLLDDEDSDWEDSNDKMLVVVALIGTAFKKTYFDPVLNKNISRYCHWKNVVVHDNTPNLKEARRITHTYHMAHNEVMQYVNFGVFLDLDEESDDKDLRCDDVYEIAEQHTYFDLDGDGFEEPYIVTVNKSQNKVLRIAPRFDSSSILKTQKGQIYRIIPIENFTDFHFLPSPEGKFYSYGYGTLLLSANMAVNDIMNQMINSGQLYNLNAGFVADSLRKEGGPIKIQPGALNRVKVPMGGKIQDYVFPLPFHEPSQVLSSLVQYLIAGAEKLTSVSDVMTGSTDAQYTKPTTVQTLLQQSMTVQTSIQKRMYRSFKREFRKLFILNSFYLDPALYAQVLDDPEANKDTDFDLTKIDIIPVIDPVESEDLKKEIRKQELLQIMQMPGVNIQACVAQFVEESTVFGKEAILQPEEKEAPPDPKLLQIQSNMQIAGEQLQIDLRDQKAREEKIKAEIIKLKADAIKSIAEAEAAEAGTQLGAYEAQIRALESSISLQHEKEALANARTPQG